MGNSFLQYEPKQPLFVGWNKPKVDLCKLAKDTLQPMLHRPDLSNEQFVICPITLPYAIYQFQPMTQTSNQPKTDPDSQTSLAQGAALAEPIKPHDDLSFEELAESYNFKMTSDHQRVFTRLVIKECQKRTSPLRVLDVGCGRGIGRRPEYQWAIRSYVDEYWGLDPDESRFPQTGLFDKHQHALMETAQLPENYFDVAYSYMVMEHVADPIGFLEALVQTLKPGGVYIFLTPNKRHYFTRTASLLHSLKIDEIVLRLIKRNTVDDYHYPVQYLFNDEKRIDNAARNLEFDKPQFVYLEQHGPRGYMPGPLKIIYHLLRLKRKLLRNQKSLVGLTCRLTKSASENTQKTSESSDG